MNSTTPQLGTLKRIDARTVWKHEALDFTPWVKASIELLSDALQMELEFPETEVPVGDFACDLVAQEVGTDHKVIIENQLEPTDHTHLGQVLTYAAGIDARAAVWIAPQFRPEHRQVIDWLNANTVEGLAFFGVEVELLQIDSSPYAAHFKLVAQPNDWQKAVKAKSEPQPSERGLIYKQFFADLLTCYKQTFPTQRTAKKAFPQGWITVAGAGRSGFAYNVSFARNSRMRAELYIDTGDATTNKSAFDQLLTRKDDIEAEIGEELSWERLDSGRSSRIAAYRSGHVMDPEPLRTQHIEWCLVMTDKFRQVFTSRIQRLQLGAPAAPLVLIDEAPEAGALST